MEEYITLIQAQLVFQKQFQSRKHLGKYSTTLQQQQNSIVGSQYLSLLSTNYRKIQCQTKSLGLAGQVEEHYNFIFHYQLSNPDKSKGRIFQQTLQKCILYVGFGLPTFLTLNYDNLLVQEWLKNLTAFRQHSLVAAILNTCIPVIIPSSNTSSIHILILPYYYMHFPWQSISFCLGSSERLE